MTKEIVEAFRWVYVFYLILFGGLAYFLSDVLFSSQKDTFDYVECETSFEKYRINSKDISQQKWIEMCQGLDGNAEAALRKLGEMKEAKKKQVETN